MSFAFAFAAEVMFKRKGYTTKIADEADSLPGTAAPPPAADSDTEDGDTDDDAASVTIPHNRDGGFADNAAVIIVSEKVEDAIKDFAKCCWITRFLASCKEQKQIMNTISAMTSPACEQQQQQ